MQLGIEKKFYTETDVKKLMEANSKVSSLIDSLGEFNWQVLPIIVTKEINARRIREDDISRITGYNNLIMFSNQHFWAYSTVNPKNGNYHIFDEISNIMDLLWGQSPVNHSDEEAQNFLKNSISLGENAVEHQDFKSQDIEKILSSYIQRGYKTGEQSSGKPLLINVLDDIHKNEGFYQVLDFFDRYCVEGGMFVHPFPSYGLDLGEPFNVKLTDFLNPLKNKFGYESFTKSEDPKKMLRLYQTMANFYFQCIDATESLSNQMQSGLDQRIFTEGMDRIMSSISFVYDTISPGLDFVDFLKTHGFNRGVRDRYVFKFEHKTNTKTGYDYSRKAQHQSPNQDMGQELNILGLLVMPEDFAKIKAAYRKESHIWHPDKGLPNTEEKMKDINNAYDSLKNVFGEK